jgi:flavodoxin
MKIGIIIHSQSGHTYSVAQKLQEKLIKAGQTASIERLIPDDEKQTDAKRIHLKTIPDISKYDALVLGGPVRGFSASPAIKAYLSNIDSFKNKKVAVMVTQSFPFPKMGGNQAIALMKSACESKGAAVCDTGIINWSNWHREKMITELVEKFSCLF